jgi:hypothetical protein
MDKQRSTKHTHKTKDRVTQNQLKTWDEQGCFGIIIKALFTYPMKDIILELYIIVISDFNAAISKVL